MRLAKTWPRRLIHVRRYGAYVLHSPTGDRAHFSFTQTAKLRASVFIKPTRPVVARSGKRKSTALEINLALWGMIVCSGIELVGWVQAAL
jgi:hypothetical protein